MSDVTALVLSLGEDYTERAINSVRCQTLPTAETIVVQGISPFHRAFNSGVSRVRTKFFIQVDADMILDENCVEELRDLVSDGIGCVVGYLRDPLLGRIVGVNLFRTQCFSQVKLRDSLSSETDFEVDSLTEGWSTIYARKNMGPMSTLGEHRPDYNPHYTFCKFMRDGAKARFRRAGHGLRGVFRQLQTSGHKAATIATIAAAHGIFIREKHDLHGPPQQSEEFQFLEQFLRSAEVSVDRSSDAAEPLRGNLQKSFKRFYELGVRLRRHDAPSIFLTHMRGLHQQYTIGSWVALVGLCHGLFVDEYDETEAKEAFAVIKELLPAWHLWRFF